MNDPKCTQYTKPEKRQMFAVQIVDDLLDREATCLVNDVPEGEAPLGIMNEDDNYESGAGAATPHEDNGPDGTQYDEELQLEDLHLDEYDGYALPTDESDFEYMQFMVTTTCSTNTLPLQIEKEPIEEESDGD